MPAALCAVVDMPVDLLRIDPLCCVGDINQDGVVGILDLLLLLGAWTAFSETCCCPEDLDGDGDVDVIDLEILRANWGPCSQSGQQVPIEVQKCLDKYLPEDPNGAARCVAKLTTE
ncbi:MAG: hypothetical protein IH830_04120 [Planctomycetes bacterium]|nr:hypothetical protein [Planctomycetota bacterium]